MLRSPTRTSSPPPCSVPDREIYASSLSRWLGSFTGRVWTGEGSGSAILGILRVLTTFRALTTWTHFYFVRNVGLSASIPEQASTGFKLKNKNNKNIYKDVTSKKDCQQICQVAKGCNFFNFDLSAKTCHLKYGVGKKNEWLSKDTQSIWFGPAYCPGSHAC